MSGYKISIQQLIAFLYTRNEQSENTIKKTPSYGPEDTGVFVHLTGLAWLLTMWVLPPCLPLTRGPVLSLDTVFFSAHKSPPPEASIIHFRVPTTPVLPPDRATLAMLGWHHLLTCSHAIIHPVGKGLLSLHSEEHNSQHWDHPTDRSPCPPRADLLWTFTP